VRLPVSPLLGSFIATFLWCVATLRFVARRLAIRYPYCFGIMDKEGGTHILAATDGVDQASWMALLAAGENTFKAQVIPGALFCCVKCSWER
jgi:hypothetical protein